MKGRLESDFFLMLQCVKRNTSPAEQNNCGNLLCISVIVKSGEEPETAVASLACLQKA